MAELTSRTDLDGMLASRRDRSVAVRDLTDGTGNRQEATAESDGPPFTSGLNWLLGIAAGIAIIASSVLAVLMVPPLMSCRDHAERGFFVGETFDSCLSNGVPGRMTRFEDKIKAVVLRSGR